MRNAEGRGGLVFGRGGLAHSRGGLAHIAEKVWPMVEKY